MQFDRVVIAVDFSAASLAAARWVATQLAPRAELALVHVVSEPVPPSFVRPHLPSLADGVTDTDVGATDMDERPPPRRVVGRPGPTTFPPAARLPRSLHAGTSNSAA